jgi:protein involved in polysaccharide export with SLBB domain
MAHVLQRVGSLGLPGLVLLALVLMIVAPAAAQTPPLDPQTLRQLQNQLGQQAPQAVATSPVDAAREAATRREDAERLRAAQPTQLPAAAADPVMVTPIEQELRRRSGNTDLRLFGTDLFRQAQPQAAAALTGRLGDDYVLGVGDEVVVTFQGPTSRTVTTRVDREGRLVVDQLRPIAAAGRSFGTVRRELEAATRATLLGTDVFVSVSTVRAISVFVGGAVTRPGQYVVTSLTDLATVIGRAGGVAPTGSLRRVRLERAGRVIPIDLYGLLGIGSTPTVRLQDGDRLVVPTLGPVIAVSGSVNRPAIYETSGQGSMTLRQALGMAGGALRPAGNEFVLSRIDGTGVERITTITNPDAVVRGGDVIFVNPREAGTQGSVRLSGFVQAPGVRSLTATPSVRALLGSPRNLRPGTYMPFAVLIRYDDITRARTLQGVDLTRTLSSGPDVPLRSDDELVIFSDAMLEVLRSGNVRSIVLGSKTVPSTCRALRALDRLVRDTQGNRFVGVVRGSFVVDRNGTTAVADTGSLQAQMGIRGADSAAMVTNGEARDSAERETDAQGCYIPFEQWPDLLPFMLEHVAVIGGAVRSPGVFPIMPETAVASVLAVAGGLTRDADPGQVELLRFSDVAEQEQRWQLLAAADSAPDRLSISPGDELRYKPRRVNQEAGSVLLSGEVARPGVYTIRRGETMSELLARAGGMTDQAYPYGAVFTRRSVRLAQQEGLRRSAREMSSALLTLSGRRDVQPDSIATAARLVEQMSTADLPGRMVIEADPRVLDRRPDLETVLEPGDSLFIPKRPNAVLVLGDVLNPGAVQFVEGRNLNAYLSETGGFQRTADDDRVFLVLPNGVAQPIRASGWRRSGNVVIPPGSAIVVPKDIDPLRNLDLIRDVGTIISQFAVSAASIAVLARGN